MEFRSLHDWNLTYSEAKETQQRLADAVREEPLNVEAVVLAAGADISFAIGPEADSSAVAAGFVTLRLPSLEVVESAGVRTVSRFPYIPGLLSFREVPPLLEAWAQLAMRPDVLIADGHGRAHPRRFGLACHLGLILDIPCVGVAKSRFVGAHEPVPEEVGAWTPLVHRGETVGAALRLKAKAAPIYVSVGHRADLPGAVALALRCRGKTRVPETTRQAHLFVNALRRDSQKAQGR